MHRLEEGCPLIAAANGKIPKIREAAQWLRADVDGEGERYRGMVFAELKKFDAVVDQLRLLDAQTLLLFIGARKA